MKKDLIFSFLLFGEVGLSVSIPLVALGLLGRYLDTIYNTKPYLFLLGIALSTVIVFFYLKKIVKKYTQKLKDRS